MSTGKNIHLSDAYTGYNPDDTLTLPSQTILTLVGSARRMPPSPFARRVSFAAEVLWEGRALSHDVGGVRQLGKNFFVRVLYPDRVQVVHDQTNLMSHQNRQQLKPKLPQLVEVSVAPAVGMEPDLGRETPQRYPVDGARQQRCDPVVQHHHRQLAQPSVATRASHTAKNGLGQVRRFELGLGLQSGMADLSAKLSSMPCNICVIGESEGTIQPNSRLMVDE